jgi:hypothetical protein
MFTKERVVIQPQTQTRDYWVSRFSVTEEDIEHLYNFFLETEVPHKISELARAIVSNRVDQERKEIERRLEGHTIYQPLKSYEVGEAVIFPSLKFATGEVSGVRQGYNPEHGTFRVFSVEVNGREREFAAELESDHPLNQDASVLLSRLENIDVDEIYSLYSQAVEDNITKVLKAHEGFIQLGNDWFVKALLAEVNIGHLHLAEAVLDMNGGGPLTPEEVVVHLELPENLKPEVLQFSLNYALLNDERFDEVAPARQVAWFLRRMEPEEVRHTPERLVYNNIPYDRALLSPQLRLLERELDDEWSEIEVPLLSQNLILTLNYPHRWAGTLPLNASTRTLFPVGRSPRQIITLIDEENGDEIKVWAVVEGRYIFGLKDWYEEHRIPVGGFISLRASAEPGQIILNYDRRSDKREWVRLATAEDGRIHFDLERRSVGCRYDDLMIVGTDYINAVDALFRKANKNQRPLVSLLAEIVPELAAMTPQNTVHAKTIYSAVNMLRRVPPGPVFAELVRHPAFRAVGDQYWQFDSSRWREG